MGLAVRPSFVHKTRCHIRFITAILFYKQLLSQVCDEQTCRERNSVVSIKLRTMRLRVLRSKISCGRSSYFVIHTPFSAARRRVPFCKNARIDDRSRNRQRKNDKRKNDYSRSGNCLADRRQRKQKERAQRNRHPRPKTYKSLEQSVWFSHTSLLLEYFERRE